MRAFFAGVLTTLVALAVAAVVVVATLPVADPAPPTPSPSPAPGAPGAPGAPSSVAEGETWLGDVDLSSSSVLTSDGPLTDVRATGAGVRLTTDGLRAQRLDIGAVLPFATAARQIGDVELYAAGNGRAGVRRTASVLGREIAIRATGTVRAVDGQLVIEPESVDLGGPGLVDSALSAAASRFVTIRHTVTGLPAGMRLTGVSVQQNGFRATLAGTDVVLTQ